MPDLSNLVDTVVLVMMENRSFDHMLGHLSYEKINPAVNGLQRPLKQDTYKNLHGGEPYYPFRRRNDYRLDFDLPHEAGPVATQLSRSPADKFTMSGFVEAYAQEIGQPVSSQPDPMGFFPSAKVPITSFLAQNFLVCDRWFSPIPTSTQPNRTMAFCGDTPISDTQNRLITTDSIVFDWLDGRIRWRVYHDGLSFFALYPRAIPHVVGPHFRKFESFSLDMQVEPITESPQVIIVEPSYESGPHIGSDHPNDNHPRLAVGYGEEFLREVYEAVTANKTRWEKTVMVVYYDEHGGFWDHEPPPMISYRSRQDPAVQFANMGPRIPAIIVSPLVAAGEVCSELFDHTSVLQFLADRFTPGVSYSSDVDTRRNQGVVSLSAALTQEGAREDIPSAPAAPIPVDSEIGQRIEPQDELSKAFETAARKLMEEHPKEIGEKLPELFQWRSAVDRARG